MTNDTRGHTAAVCHMCKTHGLELVLDLGFQPHSDAFPRADELNEFEATYPLRLVRCAACGLLQIDYFVDPKILYGGEYLYQSSTTETGRRHYREMARRIKERFAIQDAALAVDIGSNVGVLLGGFKEAGLAVLGVDPAPLIAKIANDSGIETIADFFSRSLAERVKQTHGSAAVITGTNVFAHLHDLDDAVEGMKVLLADTGVIVIEAPHALPLIEHVEYDTIYHQHIGYLSVKPMRLYFERVGLQLFDVEENEMHGGTLRYFVGRPGAHPISPTVHEIEEREVAFGLYDPKRLAAFASAAEAQKIALIELLLSIKKEGKRVIALSAPAKGNTLLNYCHLDGTLLAYATERNSLKVGRFTPGTHLPIYEDSKIMDDMPEYALILAWNFADEIMRNMTAYRERGGKFILPIPMPRVL